ncbi:MAG: excinuclease ABC subunit UvrC [Thermoanaerobaculales bacterium]|jgi:excinuclease ABC subunit C|nr:excinuclease ABC subunit UvrC [Thermoanaerobaculales bacterium]
MAHDHPLLERAHEAPESPGVYRYLDVRGTVLYVGKARNLRRRVLSYFGRSDLPERTRAMLERARKLDFTVTASEVEAFILENTLIKKLRPRFNVLLRDDKTYPYLKLTIGETWPRVFFTRKVRDDGHRYFGPFMGQRMARRLMDLARTRFQVRTCHIEIDGGLPRPCLYYHMKACLGPCVDGLTTPETYAEAVAELELFLAGRHRELLPRLEASMWAASEQENFELASKYRDLIAVVERLGEPQDVEQPGRGNADVIAVATDSEHASVCVLPYRDGKLVDKREFHFEGVGDVGAAALTATFITQYYEANPAVPRTVETSVDLDEDDRAMLRSWLAHTRGRAVEIAAPKRGPRARRVELARDNARAAFELRFRAPRSQAQHLSRRLGEALGLDRPVQYLECFDISHSGGKDTTASCVVWRSGRMDKRSYRSFNIRSVEGVDDFSAIAEAVTRRYRRLRDDGAQMPDLVLIDGGVGQLNAAMAALDTLGVDLAVAGLAKREEEVWLPGSPDPLRLDPSDPAHLVLRQARDEAHRFAVARHRKRRSKRTMATELINVPGIGPGRAKALLTRFGSVRGVQRASEEELQRALGPRIGRHLFQHLHAGE